MAGIFLFTGEDLPLGKEIYRNGSLEIIEESDGNLLLYNEDTREEGDLGSFNNIVGISMGNGDKYLLIEEENQEYPDLYTAHVYNLEKGLDKIEVQTLGGSIFSPSGRELLVGVIGEDKNYDLAIYRLDGKHIDPFVEGDKRPIIPLKWELGIISYKIIDGQEEILRERDLNKSEEDQLVDLMEEDGDQKRALELLKTVDYDKVEERLGGEGLVNILSWIKTKDLDKIEEVEDLLVLFKNFDGKEYFAYMELVAKSFLENKIVFIKALAKHPELAEELGYALNDLHIYEREENSMANDLQEIIDSKKLTPEEKKIGIDIINVYASCGG